MNVLLPKLLDSNSINVQKGWQEKEKRVPGKGSPGKGETVLSSLSMIMFDIRMFGWQVCLGQLKLLHFFSADSLKISVLYV